MQLATVVGNATATVKHASMRGWRLLLVQPATIDGRPDGEPLLVVDSLGASRGDTVLITNDGAAARRLVGDNTTPVRWTVVGIPDAPRVSAGQPSRQAAAANLESKSPKPKSRKRTRRKS